MLKIISKYSIIVPVIVTFIFGILNSNFYIDDGLIYGRYIKNLFDGFGLVYNKGEIFNGLTSPLYAYLTILVNYFLNDVILSLNFVSLIFHAIAVYYFYAVFSHSHLRITGLLVGLLISILPYFYLLYTMETTLYVALIAMCLNFYVKGKHAYLGVFLALLILARSEGLFLFISILIVHSFERKPMPTFDKYIAPLIILIIHFTFNYYYYGNFTPDTSGAKIAHGQSGYWKVGPWFIAWFYMVLVEGGVSLFLLFFSAVGVYKLRNISTTRIIVIHSLTLLTFYVVLDIPYYNWYYAPLVVYVVYFGIAGLYETLRALNPKNIKSVVIVSVMVCSLFLAVPIVQKFSLGRDWHYYYDAGSWISQHTENDASIAMVEIGIVGYFSDRHVIDILGLVNPINASHVAQADVVSWMKTYDADYILAHEPLWDLEEAVSIVLANGTFERVGEFQIDGLQLVKRVSDGQ